MKRLIRCSVNDNKVVSSDWNQFCKDITYKFGYYVDSASRRKPSPYIDLIKDGCTYEGEVTKYSNGDYELLLDNIYEVDDERPL